MHGNYYFHIRINYHTLLLTQQLATYLLISGIFTHFVVYGQYSLTYLIISKPEHYANAYERQTTDCQ
jgi:hypothetical protein